MSLRMTSAPAVEPVTLAEAKNHLRITASNSDEDALISNLIKAARQWCEAYTGCSFVLQTWQVKLDEFPECIKLPRGPVIAVSSITYLDTSGDSQTLASSSYRVDADTIPARVTEAYASTWPSTYPVTNAVTVTYTAGYEDTGSSPTDDVPEAIQQAILLMVAHLFENREASSVAALTEIPMGVAALLGPYRVDRVGVTV